jgi:hypothetical protein
MVGAPPIPNIGQLGCIGQRWKYQPLVARRLALAASSVWFFTLSFT